MIMSDRAAATAGPATENAPVGHSRDLSILRDLICDQHRFFVDWYNGGEAGQGGFESFERGLGAGFRLITPDGRTLERGDVIAFVRANRGIDDGGFDIEIADVAIRARGTDLVVATYTEIQIRNNKKTTRLSSAVFRSAPGQSPGFIWEHLHETWVDQKKIEQESTKNRGIK